jgi:hypothetical protein
VIFRSVRVRLVEQIGHRQSEGCNHVFGRAPGRTPQEDAIVRPNHAEPGMPIAVGMDRPGTAPVPAGVSRSALLEQPDDAIVGRAAHDLDPNWASSNTSSAGTPPSIA